jgi:hypothetical protein
MPITASAQPNPRTDSLLTWCIRLENVARVRAEWDCACVPVCSAAIAGKKHWVWHVASIVTGECVNDLSEEKYFCVLIYVYPLQWVIAEEPLAGTFEGKCFQLRSCACKHRTRNAGAVVSPVLLYESNVMLLRYWDHGFESLSWHVCMHKLLLCLCCPV